ncbi:NHL repeat-containing protein [Pseudothauera rhizosphaerae]|uniref:Uncharacterized protein n=1 Tax=Pseudothauera rhizosphaerae TaxID=2565932 RepID=A0A4S4AU31_9RHOO|nr:hypothetical protein [Pseudothauera rhizosphaerae]THF62729.1 hypothetical protein E6O51_07155 [Pseudothauera rhizosphaerae]
MKTALKLLCLSMLLPALAWGQGRIVVENAGFAAPESVVHDTRRDVYLLSNVNGRAIDNDGNGFISKVSPDGKVIALKWIDGQAPGVTLHAPKGLAIAGNVLYVADNGDEHGNVVRLFDLESGRPLGSVPVPGSYFLNGLVALPSGEVLVTDSGWQLSLSTADGQQPLAPGARRQRDGSTWTPTGQDAIYRIGTDRSVSVFARSPELAQPNGIDLLPSGNLLVASSSAGHFYELDPAGRKVNLRYLPDRGFDGLGLAPDGRVFAAGPENLHVVWPDGRVDTVAGVDTHVADLNFDRKRNRVLFPLLRADKLILEPLEAARR